MSFSSCFTFKHHCTQDIRFQERQKTTAIERTAYPRFKETLTEFELDDFYTPSPAEVTFVNEAASGDLQQLALLVLLKSFQKLGYLPRLNLVPRQIVAHVAGRMQLPLPEEGQEVPRTSRSRYRRAIHDHLQIRRCRDSGVEVVREMVWEAVVTISDPADLINVAIEQLVLHKFELPAFSTLDRLVNHIRHEVHQALYQQVTAAHNAEQKLVLEGLLERPAYATRYPFTRLKLLPKRASLKEVRRWEAHLEWLESLLDSRPFTSHLASTKVEQFAAEAYRLESGDMLDVLDERKRYTQLLCLLHHMQVRTRDQLTTMFLKRIHLLHNNARKRLRDIQDQHRELSETMVNAFADIVVQAEETEKAASTEEDERDALLGRQVRHVLQANGGAATLRDQCELLQAYHNNNYLPLLRSFYRQHRAMLFRTNLSSLLNWKRRLRPGQSITRLSQGKC